MKINDKHLWYGYLEAGNKSTAVLLDRSLNTGNPETLYLFNLARGEILEYSRKIVEPKLRELKEKETDLIASMKSAYDGARSHFAPRASEALEIPEKAASAAKKASPVKAEGEEEVESLVAAGELDAGEEEWEEDEEEEEDET